MPAPAVYVLAIFGTVGAVLAFKEFVYEPHIAPAIDRWKHEYQAARRRREAVAAHSSEGDLLMSQTDSRISGPSDTTKVSDDGDDTDDDRPLAELGKGFKGSVQRNMKGGLLLRRPDWAGQASQNPADVELDDFVAREVNEWRNEDTSQVLRQRKNASEHAMDESIQVIPYTPLSPSRTHVLFDPSVPSTPGSGSRTSSLPHSPLLSQSNSVQVDVPSGIETSGGKESPILKPQDESASQIARPKSSSLPPPGSPRVAVSPPINQTISPPPQVSPFQHTITQSTLLGNTTSTTPTFNLPTTTRDNISVSSHPLQESYTVPSLSQSYPQDLDYEHGLELLSPPSSRSESPFSMADISPNPGSDHSRGLRTLSPFGTASSVSASNFSSAVSSPSPLRMGLGNESFDAVSPILQPQQISQPVSPFPGPSPIVPSSSVTNSARSTAYLSFPDDFSEDEAYIQTQPPSNLGASIGVEGAFGPVGRSGPRLYNQAQNPSLVSPQALSLLGTRSLNNSQGGQGMYAQDTFHSTQQSRFSTHSQSEGVGLGLFSSTLQIPTAPGPAYLLDTSTFNGISHLRPSSTASSVGHNGHGHNHNTGGIAQSDGELSDLDFMSDYAPSESDLGNESDSSWSMAGGSAAASPRIGSTASVNVTRGGTIRDPRGNGRSVQR